MGKMTREEFMKVAIAGAALTTLIPRASLEAWQEQAREIDFASVFLFKNGRMYGLGYPLTGDVVRDEQGIRWLNRAMEIEVGGGLWIPPKEWEIK